MISKTSLFNKGIYKSTVKRYAWGSVLYFLILFLINGLSTIFSSDRYFRQLQNPNMERFTENPLILRGDFLGISTAISGFVPTVVALLVFRFIHSKKSSVFTHSIPVKRSANYVSSLLAAFTLMAVPVIANGIILMGISLSAYGQFFTAFDCLVWMEVLLFTLFILFSCAVFSAVITGNSFAVIILNVLVHSVLLIIAAGFVNLASVFLHGYPGDNTLFDILAENNFYGAAFSLGNSRAFRESFTLVKGAEFVIISLIIYAVSLLLYKKRKLEYAEDVAGFKCLNHIFKYGVTFIATLSAFSIFSHNIKENVAAFGLIVFIVSAVVYFATEMILRKALNIFKKSYKGYIAFAAAFAVCLSVFAFTSFFGYETRVPNTEDIESVSVFNYYYSIAEPESDKEHIKDYAVKLHGEFVSDENISVLPQGEMYDTRLHIKYRLKDGRELSRTYAVTNEERNEIMSYLYEDLDYKKQCEEVFYDYTEFTNIHIYAHRITKEKELQLKEGADVDITVEETVPAVELYSDQIAPIYGRELLKVIQSDVEKLSYSQLRGDDEEVLMSIQINCLFDKGENDDIKTDRNWLNIRITSHHTNTLKWLKDKGIILE